MPAEFFESELDGLKLCRYWELPAEKPRAMIVFAHGMLEHGGRHLDWAERMVQEQGIGVVLPDARGHGRSEGRRAWVRHFDDFVADYVQTLRFTAERFPDVPLFAMGFSMGGAIASLSVLTRQQGQTDQPVPDLAGLILVAPAIRFRGKYFPALHLTASIADFFLPKLLVAKPNFSIMSRNQNLIEQFQHDPLVHQGQLILHFSTEILKAMSRIQNLAPELTLPLLVLQGDSDWVVTPSGASELVDAVSSKDKTLKMYPGLYHTLLHEPEQDQVFSDLADWLNRKLPDRRSFDKDPLLLENSTKEDRLLIAGPNSEAAANN